MSLDEDAVERLADAVDSLVEEIHLLAQSLDDLREEFSWAIRNDPLRAPYRLTSMPLDPTAPDFAERLNQLTPADLPPAQVAPPTHARPAHQGELWT